MPDSENLIGTLAAELMEALDEDLPDAEVSDVCIVVALDDGEEDVLRIGCSGAHHVRTGMLTDALLTVASDLGADLAD